jgi:hypothetical protein
MYTRASPVFFVCPIIEPYVHDLALFVPIGECFHQPPQIIDFAVSVMRFTLPRIAFIGQALAFAPKAFTRRASFMSMTAEEPVLNKYSR